MLNQNDFYRIIQEEKFINEEIIVGDFKKRTFQIFFYDELFNSINAYLDITKSGSIEIKHHINNRVKNSIPILRLDINGHHHTNPIFEEALVKELNIDENILNLMRKYNNYKFTKESHLHYYIEPYRERWAFPPYEFNLKISNNFKKNIEEFCHNFNIKAKIIQKGLF